MNTATNTTLLELRDELAGELLTEPRDMDPHLQDMSEATLDGLPLAVVLAKNTEDVSKSLAWANANDVKVSTRGAGTGLAGGANAYANGLVISLEQMNDILEIDASNRIARVEPGVITADLDRAAHKHGLFFAPDPASSRISSIGGNIATNAGGLRCIAHGVTRDSVAQLTVVLADGRIIKTGSKTRKDVVGYDLTSLFVGSEGTLGVITEATVRLKQLPPGTPRTFRASFNTVGDASSAVLAIVNGPDQPEVLEMMDKKSVEIVESYYPSGLIVPKGAMLVGQTVGLDAAAKAQKITQVAAENGAYETEISETDSLLEARRLTNPALNAKGLKVGCDACVPVAQLSAIFLKIEEIAAKHGADISTVAHAGDGNLHVSATVGESAEALKIAHLALAEITQEAINLGGTISGEHGIGQLKQHELPMQLAPEVLEVLQSIKKALDPKGILSPGRAI